MLVTRKCVTSGEQTEVRPRRGGTARNGNSQALELLTCLPAPRASFKKQGRGEDGEGEEEKDGHVVQSFGSCHTGKLRRAP